MVSIVGSVWCSYEHRLTYWNVLLTMKYVDDLRCEKKPKFQN